MESASTDGISAVGLLVRRLSEVQDLLSALPNDAFAERAALVAERDELQLRAAQYASGADWKRPTEDLRCELEVLRGEWMRHPLPGSRRALLTARISRLAGILNERGVVGG